MWNLIKKWQNKLKQQIIELMFLQVNIGLQFEVKDCEIKAAYYFAIQSIAIFTRLCNKSKRF